MAGITEKKGSDLGQDEIKEILGTYFTSESIPSDLTDLTKILKTKTGGYDVALSEVLNGVTVGSTTPPGSGGGGETLLGPNGKLLVNQTTVAEITNDKIVGEDKFGNQVVIPAGFKLAQGANGSGETVKDGIVIDDGVGNQYVWIPVSNINHDGSNKIKVNSADEEGVEITLGRYTFNTSSPGNPTLAANSYQYANSYSTPVTIESYYQELTEYRQSNGLSNKTGTNTTARGKKQADNSYNGIQGFIESVADNKGYYIARYEASYRANGKAGSIPSISSSETLALTRAPVSRTPGDLWNFVKQGEAATACYDLYTTVNSDLMNSYAWDTAIVYIQAMGNTNYANAYDPNGTLRNTGATGDEKCKIFDMAGNEIEWTTEYSTNAAGSIAYPCVSGGGGFDYSYYYARHRSYSRASDADMAYSFRPALYL